MPEAIIIGSGPIRGQAGRFRDLLLAEGFRLIDPLGNEPLTEEELHALIGEASAVIAGSEPYESTLFDKAPRLRVIARTGVGYDAVDVEEATRRGVVLTITAGANHESVAEHGFALLLGVSRQIVENDQAIRSGRWNRMLVEPLRSKTLGLLGLGRIGRAMIPPAKAFGMSVIAYDSIVSHDSIQAAGASPRTLNELLAESDVLSLHTPLNDSTRFLMNADRFRLMKPSAILINTARGGLVDESALVDAIKSKRIAGAGLDVFGTEPLPPNHPLFQFPQVVLSPHLGGIDRLAMDKMAEMAAESIIKLARGQWPADQIVNPDVGKDWRW